MVRTYMGPVCKSRFKISEDECEVEDSDFADTLRKEELVDYNNCRWLSIGDASSPSSFIKNDGLFGHMDLKIDAWFISLLSKPSPKSGQLLSTEVTFFDGSRANPIEEASLVLDERKVWDKDVVLQEKLEEEDVVSWLSSITDNSDDHCSLLSSSFTSDYSSEVIDLEEIGSDNKPLFWPLHSASDNWCPGTKFDFFIMSPRKNVDKLGNSPKESPDTLRVKVLNGNMNSEKSCTRRLEFISDTKSLTNMTETKKTTKSASKNKIVLEDLLLVEKLNVDGAIEEVLGLGEFDGHEGVESEFNKDEFSFV